MLEIAAAMQVLSLTDIARHRAVDDLWVVYGEMVLDISSFLDEHPGGRNVLLRRAGTDVSKAFDDIGHSQRARAQLQSFQVATLQKTSASSPALHEGRNGHQGSSQQVASGDSGRVTVGASRNAAASESSAALPQRQPLARWRESEGFATAKEAPSHAEDMHTDNAEVEDGHDNNEEGMGEAAWHAMRRKEILSKHPAIADLLGPCPATLGLGLIVVVIHAVGLYYASSFSLNQWYVPVLLGWSLGAFCKMYQFVVAHEICHNLVVPPKQIDAITRISPLLSSSLVHDGLMRFMTLPSVSNAIYEYYAYNHLTHHSRLGSSSLIDAVEALVFEGTPFDGDIISAGVLALRSRIQKNKGVDTWFGFTGVHFPHRVLLVLSPALHAFHFFWMLQWATYCFVSIPVGMLAVIYRFNIKNNPVFALIHKKYSKEFRTRTLQTMKSRLVRGGLGVQVLIAMAVNGVIVGLWGPYAEPWGPEMCLWNSVPCGVSWERLVAVANGLCYLAVSEMCIHGFLWHPYGSYFMTVHRSIPPNAQDKCQPTMSCYSKAAALATGFLTYHVEHHDFPQVAWCRLPQVTEIAPEFYNSLQVANGFFQTVVDYWNNGSQWTYACQGFSDLNEQMYKGKGEEKRDTGNDEDTMI